MSDFELLLVGGIVIACIYVLYRWCFKTGQDNVSDRNQRVTVGKTPISSAFPQTGRRVQTNFLGTIDLDQTVFRYDTSEDGLVLPQLESFNRRKGNTLDLHYLSWNNAKTHVIDFLNERQEGTCETLGVN
ncbi:hypothetical protein ElyMa_005100700 [Elysia marginata]|uniref:Uncharacterized protein n=1 Tax=Elysia marginata TaxID=1093978 RepID=A0AAV4JK66_9GAST|nr:hypothetical protein ElyMa_005100700 [Elysia marginata]